MKSIEWKVVKESPEYEVSNTGLVRDKKSHEIIPTYQKKGFLRAIDLNDSTFCLGRLVAEAFIPNPINLPHVKHINKEHKTDNSVSNLKWGVYAKKSWRTDTPYMEGVESITGSGQGIRPLNEEERDWLEKFNNDQAGFIRKDDSTYSDEERRSINNQARSSRRNKEELIKNNYQYISTSDDYAPQLAGEYYLFNPEALESVISAYEAAIEVSVANPVWGKRKVAKELEKRGFSLDPESIGLIWKDEDLSNRDKRKQAQLVEA